MNSGKCVYLNHSSLSEPRRRGHLCREWPQCVQTFVADEWSRSLMLSLARFLLFTFSPSKSKQQITEYNYCSVSIVLGAWSPLARSRTNPAKTENEAKRREQKIVCRSMPQWITSNNVIHECAGRAAANGPREEKAFSLQN